MAIRCCILLFILALSPAPAQIMAPPQPRPTWFSEATPGQGLRVYDPTYNMEIAFLSQSGYTPGPFAMDPLYQHNGYNTVVQATGGQLDRWGLPPRSTWPAPLVNLATDPITVPSFYGFIISNASFGELVALDFSSGVTRVRRYIRTAPGSPNWRFFDQAQLQNFASGLFNQGRVTVDCNGMFWIAGTTGSPALLRLWRWSPNQNPGQDPAPLLFSQQLGGDEELSWLSAERPCSGTCSPTNAGWVWACTRSASTRDGIAAYRFDSAQAPGGVAVRPWGGNQIWPVPGSTGLAGGVYMDSLQTAWPPSAWNHENLCTGCSVPTALPDNRNPTAHQILFDPANPKPILAAADPSSFPKAVFYLTFSHAACAPATFLYEALAGVIGVPAGPLVVLGTGWPYPQYIATGTVTNF